MNQSHIAALLQSKKPAAMMLGWAVLFVFFVPDVARVMGNPDLDVWDRVEAIALAVGKTLGAVALAAIPPSVLHDDDQPNA